MLLDSDKNRLRHMIDAASEALEHSQNRTRAELDGERALQHLLVRNLEILGEAASRVSPELRSVHPEIPWRTIISTRNRLIHAYFEIDLDIVWSTVQGALPTLLAKLRALLEHPQDD
jgi:uncharacterized protein with HEPN domain